MDRSIVTLAFDRVPLKCINSGARHHAHRKSAYMNSYLNEHGRSVYATLSASVMCFTTLTYRHVISANLARLGGRHLRHLILSLACNAYLTSQDRDDTRFDVLVAMSALFIFTGEMLAVHTGKLLLGNDFARQQRKDKRLKNEDSARLHNKSLKRKEDEPNPDSLTPRHEGEDPVILDGTLSESMVADTKARYPPISSPVAAMRLFWSQVGETAQPDRSFVNVEVPKVD